MQSLKIEALLGLLLTMTTNDSLCHLPLWTATLSATVLYSLLFSDGASRVDLIAAMSPLYRAVGQEPGVVAGSPG